MKVTVVYAAPGIEILVPVAVPAGATVADAFAASGIVTRLALPASIAFAIHGQRARGETPLVNGDRIEITRPLVADAKSIRRARAADRPLPKTHKDKRSEV